MVRKTKTKVSDKEDEYEAAEKEHASTSKNKQGSEKPDQSKTVDGKEVEQDVQKQLLDMKDKYVRLLAEYDNFRKRTAREKEMYIKNAAEDIITEMLPILDNLDRATEHRNDKTTYEDYVKGIALIEQQIREVLARAGLEYIEVAGKPFDPDIHEAIMQIESDEHESGIITAEAEKGYMLSGKVIRFPKVIVSK
ncbi:nucleotide exchange factor GrpE [Candidatus Omnitrophota bacterium]